MTTEPVQPSPAPQNAFKKGDAAKHLKALLDRLTGKA
jgi:hypothetical protein